MSALGLKFEKPVGIGNAFAKFAESRFQLTAQLGKLKSLITSRDTLREDSNTVRQSILDRDKELLDRVMNITSINISSIPTMQQLVNSPLGQLLPSQVKLRVKYTIRYDTIITLIQVILLGVRNAFKFWLNWTRSRQFTNRKLL